jgi:hypothetical protein
LDHNVNTDLADELRLLGYDVLVPRETGMAKATDEAHLVRAASEGRVLITHDFKDFSRIATEWFEAGRSHAGIILAPQPPAPPYRMFVTRLLILPDELSAEELFSLVQWV